MLTLQSYLNGRLWTEPTEWCGNISLLTTSSSLLDQMLSSASVFSFFSSFLTTGDRGEYSVVACTTYPYVVLRMSSLCTSSVHVCSNRPMAYFHVEVYTSTADTYYVSQFSSSCHKWSNGWTGCSPVCPSTVRHKSTRSALSSLINGHSWKGTIWRMLSLWVTGPSWRVTVPLVWNCITGYGPSQGCSILLGSGV
jgi:hypothetical protein